MLGKREPEIYGSQTLEDIHNSLKEKATLRHIDVNCFQSNHEGELVELHSVGGTMLLVRADVHRDGLVFPAYPYGLKNERVRDDNLWQGEIETEGLAIMAHDMGVTYQIIFDLCHFFMDSLSIIFDNNQFFF